MIAGAASEVSRVGLGLQLCLVRTAHALSSLLTIFLEDAFLGKIILDLLASDVDSGHYDVTWGQIHQLQDAFSEVGLHHVDAVMYEVLVEVTFLCQHRLTLDDSLDAVLAHYLHHDVVIFVGILCPMHDGTVGRSIALELLQVVRQMGYCMFLDVTCGIAQLLPLLEFIGQHVALGANAPESLVVASHLVGIGEKLLCRYRMFCAHSPCANISTT